MDNKVSAIEKAIEILKRLAHEPYEMTALELSNELHINRSTVHRILGILMDEVLVLHNPLSRKYSLGPTAYHIGSAYLSNQGNPDQVRSILSDVARETQQSIGYAMLVGEQIINIYEVENYQPIKIGYRAGTFYPIHCGAYGKTIMAFFEPRERLEEIVYSSDLYKKTPKTITDPEKLLKEYEKIRNQGYCISDEENLKGAIGIGAPVKDSRGKVIACVAAAALKSNLSEDDLDYIREKVIAGAERISRLIP